MQYRCCLGIHHAIITEPGCVICHIYQIFTFFSLKGSLWTAHFFMFNVYVSLSIFLKYNDGYLNIIYPVYHAWQRPVIGLQDNFRISGGKLLTLSPMAFQILWLLWGAPLRYQGRSLFWPHVIYDFVLQCMTIAKLNFNFNYNFN